MLMAGLKGVKEGYPLADPVEENIYKMSSSKQKKLEIQVLPRNLEEAVKLMEKSELMRDTLGDHIFKTFLANKKAEIEEYNINVSREFEKQFSDFEVRKYLPFL